MTMRRLARLLPLLPFALVACSGQHPAPAAPPPSYAAMARGVVDVEGGLLRLMPRSDGVVATVPVTEGAVVQRGQLLLTLDTRAAELGVAMARAELDQARAHAEELAARLPAAQTRAERVAAAARAAAASQQDSADAASTLASLRAEISAARASIGVAQARLAQAQHELDLRSLRAPVAGTIVRRYVQPGETVSALAAQPLFELQPQRPLIVRAELNESYIDQVQPGMRAEVVLDAGSGRTWPAHVLRLGLVYGPTRLGPQHDQPADAHDVDCVLALDAAGLRVGQRVLVKFITNRKNTERVVQ
ncbi:MAG TPA: efflux RND transporter periplasmic adaptor subunit [Rhodanobacteraceae bacterium]|nr:efflux RND transporter periplasmic adaptor subunit [Rhodanobacteraceae bacterium]